jgi:hypothetical protein
MMRAREGKSVSRLRYRDYSQLLLTAVSESKIRESRVRHLAFKETFRVQDAHGTAYAFKLLDLAKCMLSRVEREVDE